MVLLEAMYFDVPILSSLNGGSSYLLSDENIATDFDVSLWVSKIKNMDNNTNYNKNNLCWNTLVDAFINEYNRKKNNE